MNRILFLVSFLFLSISASAQSIWIAADQAVVDKVTYQPKFKSPTDIEVFEVDPQALSSKLINAVDRFSGGTGILVDFPVGGGKFETFEIFNSGAVSEGLQAQYPNIRSYYGFSSTNSLNKIYFTITPKGFHGLLTGATIRYMDPVARATPNTIVSYNRKNLHRSSDDNFECHVIDQVDERTARLFDESNLSKAFGDQVFRTYRMAIGATAEYTAYHDDGDNTNGNAVSDALAGIIVTLTRVNSVYEQEMSMRFTLVANNSQVIYTNPNTDPYSNYSGSAMLSENTTTLQNRIGSANYDIGHVFSTGGGGIAGTSPCGSGKERGVTGIVTPEFDPFDIDYVSHEIGHQFGASHTFYNGCFGGSPSSSPYETGSASTIMGYAGICAPNVQDNSDAYFHLISLFQMQNSIDGDNCEQETSLVGQNSTSPSPVNPGNKTIPRSTPFKLTSTSSTAPDAGDTYTYNWEQLDTGTAANTGATQPPVSTNTTGPMFRSKFATTNPTRYFPNLPDLIDNVDPEWEELPSVSRDMRFFCTIRDNNPAGGQSDYAGTTLSVGTAGPFVVDNFGAGTIWHEGETQNVSWTVGGTNNTTYSTTVNILLSQDGGYTYPITLASGVNNDGSQDVVIPVGAATDQARIMVEAADNYFFDITNSNFEIKEGTFELTTASNEVSSCQPSDVSFSFTYNAAPGFGETVTFTTIDLPAGLSASFSPTSATGDVAVDVSITGTGGIDAGQYDFSIEATTASATISENFSLKIFNDEVGEVVQTAPVNGAGNQIANPLLEWEDLASASSYVVDISEFSDFNTIAESATVNNENSYQPSGLTHSKIYYWRVTPSNGCIGGSATSISSFQTAQDVCNTYDQEYFENNDNVWETDVNAVSARVFVPDDIEITELSFYMRADHNDTGHIKMQLSAPSGRFSEVYNRECAAGRDFDLIVSDSGTQAFGCNPGYTGALTGNQRPGQAFTRFNGLSAQGEWVLLATDRTSGTGGTFNEFSVDVCGRLQYVNDVDNNTNAGLSIPFGNTKIINNALLQSAQSGATTSELTYVITKDVAYGALQLNGVDLEIGDTFTQDDLDSNSITYVHTSLTLANTDVFGYTVLGKSDTILLGDEFQINIEDPILTYDAGAWEPFAPRLDTGALDAQVLSGLAVLGSDAAINNLSIVGAMTTLELNATLEIQGNLNVAGLLDAQQGVLSFNGSGTQTISGTGLIEVDDLILSNGSDLAFSVATDIYGVLYPNSATLATGDVITFKSNASTTGQLADASLALITGNFNVENYIPAKRSFRFLASSLNTFNSIYDNWQEAGASPVGFGTHITGSNAADGFDVTGTGNNSLFTFENNIQSWQALSNTNVNNLQIGQPLRMLVRGDRTVDLTSNNPTPTATTLRSSGTVHQGDYDVSYTTINGDFVMLANPYQAVVDMDQVFTDLATSGINTNFIFVYDPTINTRGAYTSIDLRMGDGFSVPASDANKYLQPGQSIFVAATGPASIGFEESYKAVGQNRLDIFTTPQQSTTMLVSLKDDTGTNILDQTYIDYRAGGNNGVDQNDALKFFNQDEILAVKTGNDKLSIEYRDIPTVGETTYFNLIQLRSSAYQLDFDLTLPVGVTATLVDQENGTRTLLNQGVNSYAFQVAAAGMSPSRFYIEYGNSTLSQDDQTLESSLQVFPNPLSGGNLQIASPLLNGQEVELVLFNTLGQRIFEHSQEFNGVETIELGDTLSSGMYLLRITTDSEQATIQLIIK